MGRHTIYHTQYKRTNSQTSSTSSTNSIEVKKIKGCNVYNLLREVEDRFTTLEEPRVSMVKKVTPSTSKDTTCSQLPMETILMNIDKKIDELSNKLDIYNGRLVHKISSIGDEQEMLREGHVALIGETRRLKDEDATLYTTVHRFD